MAKKTRFTIATPLAIASFPHLDKPDLYVGKGKKAEDAKPKYKIKLIFDRDTDFSRMEEKMLEAMQHEWGPKVRPAAVKSCVKDGDEINQARDDNGKDPIDSIAGKFVIDAASLYQPDTRDAKKRPIQPKLIRGGDGVKALLELVPCEPNGKRTIGVRLLAVQLVEKNSTAGEGWGSAFDEEEGFEGDGEAESEDTESEGENTSSGGKGGDGGDEDF